MSFKGFERRLRTRFRARLPFTLHSDGQEVRGTTRNVSLLGISAYTNGPLPLVQSVQCLLELPQAVEPVTIKGTVIRCDPVSQPHPDGSFEMGVFFKEFQEEGESLLSKFLNQTARQEASAIKAGYRILQQRLTARRRRKRLEALRKKRRQQERLRRRRQRLAQQKKRLKARSQGKRKQQPTPRSTK